MEKSPSADKKISSLLRVAPGLRNLLGYQREWLRHDAVAGVSVAAVALPTAIAYAELIGFEPVVGLYAAPSHCWCMRFLARRATSSSIRTLLLAL